jgi:hypothetical protein
MTSKSLAPEFRTECHQKIMHFGESQPVQCDLCDSMTHLFTEKKDYTDRISIINQTKVDGKCFDAFTKTLTSNEFSGITSLILSSVKLNSIALAAIATSLRSLESADLTRNLIGPAEISVFMAALYGGGNRECGLKHFMIAENSINEGVTEIARVFQYHKTCKIESLEFSDCGSFGIVGSRAIASALESRGNRLAEIEIGNCNVGRIGIEVIAAAIATEYCRLEKFSFRQFFHPGERDSGFTGSHISRVFAGLFASEHWRLRELKLFPANANVILNALCHQDTLRVVQLHGSVIDTFFILTPPLNRKMRLDSLSLNSSHFSSPAAFNYLAIFLEDPTTFIGHVNLFDCSLGDKNARRLSRVLLKNPMISSLNLKMNPDISDVGFNEIATVLCGRNRTAVHLDTQHTSTTLESTNRFCDLLATENFTLLSFHRQWHTQSAFSHPYHKYLERNNDIAQLVMSFWRACLTVRRAFEPLRFHELATVELAVFLANHSREYDNMAKRLDKHRIRDFYKLVYIPIGEFSRLYMKKIHGFKEKANSMDVDFVLQNYGYMLGSQQRNALVSISGFYPRIAHPRTMAETENKRKRQ